MRSIKDMFSEIVTILNGSGIEYAIVGGMAVGVWGNTRTTRDVDVILLMKEDDIPKMMKELKNSNFSVEEKDMRSALREKSHFSIFDKLSIYHADVKGAYKPNEVETVKDRQEIKMADIMIYVASPEDTIANKLLFGREHDIKDAEGIYARQLGNLDTEKLEQKCKKLGVYEEFIDMKKRVEKCLEEIES